MTKEDKGITLGNLQTGMIVRTADGVLRLWLSGTAVSIAGGGGVASSFLNNDLTGNKKYNDVAITHVYSAPNSDIEYCADLTWWFENDRILEHCMLLWERNPAIVKMTIEEISEALGKYVCA